MKPLADRLRPKKLNEVLGQQHLVGKNGVLTKIIEKKAIPNMVFFGPPGTGKTTVANIIANETDRKLHKLNGTTANISDIKQIVDEIDTLEAPNGVLLYLDEIQYFNKKQQQTLLEFMENGSITLIASTTENPYFYVYGALLSRSSVFEFKHLTPDEITPVVDRAFSKMSEDLNVKFTYDNDIKEHIAYSAGGDVRKAINAVELLCLASPSAKDEIAIDKELLKTALNNSSLSFDRDGDNHFDCMSALQKSIRGSDPDAALHYLARLLSGGDLISACRRIMVTACEDIGLAYPQAISIVKSCVDAAFMLGLPEARIPLADAVVLLATAPKSNSAYVAIDNALSDLEKGKGGQIPSHIRDAHYSGAKKIGRGLTYKYPHSYENHYIQQQYLPDDLKDTKYYEFGDNKLEQATKSYWDKIKGKK